MDDSRFDQLVKSISLATSRRQLVRISGVAAIGAVTRVLTGSTQGVSAQATPIASPWPADPGALVRTTAIGKVGLLLDDFPEGLRERVATEVTALPHEWWRERVRQQLYLSNYRLVYRRYFYDEPKNNLPLPPGEIWSIAIGDEGPFRTTVDGHDLIVVDYAFSSTILTDVESPGISEPALAEIGGTWDELFVFPIDPTLLVQRTGFACMDEDQYPPETISEEAAAELYDDSCDVEIPGEQVCHLTEPLPAESCVDALTRAVGHIETTIRYERLPWDLAEADRVRVGVPTTVDTADFEVISDKSGLGTNHIVYRYFNDEHCALIEGCIGAAGWRRLVNFNTRTHNVGGGPIIFGELDYANEGFATDLMEHHVYQFAGCHQHYHFQHYGTFSFDAPGALDNNKNGFCIESTDRLSNNETTPLHSDFGCDYQGLSSGWGDLYISSIVCNWVDVTDVDTSGGPVTADLRFRFNPEGFLCEGELVTDADGKTVWEETGFTTPDGEIVSRPVCNSTPGADENNLGVTEVTLPVRGGMLTQACQDSQVMGPLRNCGFTAVEPYLACAAGEPVTLSCVSADAIAAHVIRICETSQVLGTGVDCMHIDSLANVVLVDGSVEFSIVCPPGRDATEPGGELAVYVAPVIASDPVGSVSCTLI